MQPIAPNVFFHGSRTKKQVALTFDACATHSRSGYDERVLSVLLEMKTPATLFLSGKWVIEHRSQTQFLAKHIQFEIGNHSFIHPHCTEISAGRLQRELTLTQQILFTVTGKQPTLFRAPYGEFDERVLHAAAQQGLTTVQYDLPSGDPDTNATKEKLIEYVSTMTKNGSVIVMHMNGRGWHTAEALPEIIDRLRKRGFIFVTVSELMKE